MKKRQSLARREGHRYRIPMRDVKAQRNLEIIDFLRTHSTDETAKEFRLSGTTIISIAHAYKFDLSSRQSRKYKREKLIASGLLGTMPDVDLARIQGVDPDTVASARKLLKIKKYSAPLGCERCKKKPYARGMCKRCYSRWLYWSKK